MRHLRFTRVLSWEEGVIILRIKFMEFNKQNLLSYEAFEVLITE